MAVSGGWDKNEAILLMTLSGHAYIDRTPLPGESVPAQQARMRKDINSALAGSPYTGWQVSWGPGLNQDRSNMMYVAGNPTANRYAVVVRGTDFTFVLDWIQDFAAVLGLVPFDPAGGDPVQVSAGAALGLDELTAMKGIAPAGEEQDLVTFLEGLGPDAEVFVTGHSLGGCLASLLAAWLADGPGGLDNLKVYTFAAPSPGNADFADYYNARFTDGDGASTAFRGYNTLDIVPDAWASLSSVGALYVPAPPCTDELKAIVGFAALLVGDEYVQVGTTAAGSAVALTGHVVPPPAAAFLIDPAGDARFFFEVDQQHATSMYLSLLSLYAAPMTGLAVAKLQSLLQDQEGLAGAAQAAALRRAGP